MAIAFFLPARPALICPGGPFSAAPCFDGLDHRLGLRVLIGAAGLVACAAILLIDHRLSRREEHIVSEAASGIR
jgi:hypothetical protein